MSHTGRSRWRKTDDSRRTKALGVVLALGVSLLLAACTASGDPGVGAPVAQVGAVDGSDPDLSPPSPALLAKARLADCPSVDPGAKPVAGGLPDVTLRCLGAGPTVNLAKLRGPLVVNLWGSWCANCIPEMPILGEVSRAAPKNVQFLGIDVVETNTDNAVSLLDLSRIRYPSVRDDDRSTQVGLRWQGPPTLYFVNSEGAIVGRKFGAVADAAELRSLILQYLGVSVPA